MTPAQRVRVFGVLAAGLTAGVVALEYAHIWRRGHAPLPNETDRATWISFENKGPLEILVEGDTKLFNQYGAILVDPEKHPHVKKAEGQAFIDWLISPAGQEAIAGYRINGQQLFYPNAKPAS